MKKDDLPEIDAITLDKIFNSYILKLQQKINQVRELCKVGELQKVLKMRQENDLFTSQLQEIQQRATYS